MREGVTREAILQPGNRMATAQGGVIPGSRWRITRQPAIYRTLGHVDRMSRTQKEEAMTPARTAADAPSRTQRLEARLPAEAKAVIQHAANISGRSLSDFVVSSALKAAHETIREHEIIVLSVRDSLIFAEALLDPKGPNEALLAAADRYRERFGDVSGGE